MSAALAVGEAGEIYMRRAADGAPATSPPTAAATARKPWRTAGRSLARPRLLLTPTAAITHWPNRRTDMILVGGSNVYPAEIEAALEEHRRYSRWR